MAGSGKRSSAAKSATRTALARKVVPMSGSRAEAEAAGASIGKGGGSRVTFAKLLAREAVVTRNLVGRGAKKTSDADKASLKRELATLQNQITAFEARGFN